VESREVVTGYKTYGTCYRCSIPIRPSTGHTITMKLINTYWAINIICEQCQKDTNIPERLRFYADWVQRIRMSADDWKLLAEAVWAGK
jgi:hypothetical protein